jgi:hypothetical protein
MKFLSTLLLCGFTTLASAQLINGSFENNGSPDLTGWTSLCGAMSSSPDVPVGTGSWSITIPQIDHWTCPQDFVYQQLPFVHCGDVWNLGVWARTDEPAQLGMSIHLATWDGSAFQDIPGSGFGTDQVDWSHASIDVGIFCDPPDTVYLILDAGNLFPDSTYGNVWFDDITLLPVSTSSGSFDAPLQPAFRPNPATDKLWVDLPDAPISVTCIDATGRAQALKNFQHTNRTLELDVSSLPSGMNLLRIVTRSGNHTVRFVKT